VEAVWEWLNKMCEDLYTCELTITSLEGALEHCAIAMTFEEKELANKEKWLADTGLQELATTHKTVEDLQAAWAVEAQKVWDLLGQTEMALVALIFSPIRFREPAWEVSNVLPVLESTWAKMLRLEEVIGDQLEAEGRILAGKVVEHVLTCFRDQDLVVSLDPVVLGPVTEIEEAGRGSV
jgi:hypothetical protein